MSHGRPKFPLPLEAVIQKPAPPRKSEAKISVHASVASTQMKAKNLGHTIVQKNTADIQRNHAVLPSLFAERDPPSMMSAPYGAPTKMAGGQFGGEQVLTSERARSALVQRLRGLGIRDERVLRAMGLVPRHRFVDEGLASQAYEDAALPIGYQQTISHPSVVARMIEILLADNLAKRVDSPRVSLPGKVLEIGTGCGYQAAVLSLVAGEVFSIERIKPLHEKARANLRPLRIPNVRLHYGDGMLGLPQAAPFDAIILAAAGMTVPEALLTQLTIGGRLLAPISAADGEQQLLLIERTAQRKFHQTALEGVFFVPLKSGII